jgi:hypothetical protein
LSIIKQQLQHLQPTSSIKTTANMLFAKTIFITLLGLGAVAFAAPVEGTTEVNATAAAPTWDQYV